MAESSQDYNGQNNDRLASEEADTDSEYEYHETETEVDPKQPYEFSTLAQKTKSP